MLYNEIEPTLEKVAGVTKLSDNIDNWIEEITNEAYHQLPFISGKELAIELQKINQENKSAIGIMKIASGKKQVTFPLIIKEGEMFPFDVMFLDGQIIPASREGVDKFMYDPSIFRSNLIRAKGDMNSPLDPSLYPFNLADKFIGYGRNLPSPTKVAEEDYKEVMEKVEADPFIKKYLSSLLSKYQEKISIEKTASEQYVPETLNAFVAYKTSEGNIEGFGLQSSPFGIFKYKNKELEKSAEEILKTKKELFVGTGDGILNLEDIKLTTGKVKIPNIGEGYLFTKVAKLDGKPYDRQLFVTDKFTSFSDEVLGDQISTEISKFDEPAGHGIFYYSNGREIVSTLPLTIEGKKEDVLLAKDYTGLPIKLAFSKNIQVPIMGSNQEYFIPADAKFMKISEKVDGLPNLTKKLINQNKRIEMRNFENTFSFSGKPLSGLPLEEVPEKLANLILLGLGADKDQVEALKKEARLQKNIEFYTNKSFSPLDLGNLTEAKRFVVKMAEKIKQDNLKEVAILSKYLEKDKERLSSIFKFAAGEENQDPSKLVDTLLSLNFANSENIVNYIKQLPELKHVASLLAGMLIAVRLGMLSIPEQAIEGTIKNLFQVIKNLEFIKSKQNEAEINK